LMRILRFIMDSPCHNRGGFQEVGNRNGELEFG
jgi:hypothetical protein